MQTSGDNREHRHSKLECFSMLNNHTINKTLKTPSLPVVTKFSDLH